MYKNILKNTKKDKNILENTKKMGYQRVPSGDGRRLQSPIGERGCTNPTG